MMWKKIFDSPGEKRKDRRKTEIKVGNVGLGGGLGTGKEMVGKQ